MYFGPSSPVFHKLSPQRVIPEKLRVKEGWLKNFCFRLMSCKNVLEKGLSRVFELRIKVSDFGSQSYKCKFSSKKANFVLNYDSGHSFNMDHTDHVVVYKNHDWSCERENNLNKFGIFETKNFIRSSPGIKF